MEDLFRSFWWLIFPLSWFVFGAYRSWLSYRANRDTLDLIKTYAEAGRDPPPELLAKLSQSWNDEEEEESDGRPRRHRHRYRHRERNWHQVVLFAGLCAGFSYGAATDLYEAGPAFVIAAFVMGALSLASAVSILVDRGPRV